MLVAVIIFAVVIVVIGYLNTDWHPEETCMSECDSLGLTFYKWLRGGVFSDSQCFCMTHKGYPIVVGD